MRALIVVAFVLMGCGTEPLNDLPRPRGYVHPDFQQYFDEFMLLMNDAGKGDGDVRSLNIFRWTDSLPEEPTAVVGQCQELEYSDTFHKRDMWNIEILKRPYGARQLRELVFHELGHCVYKMDHREDKLAIMNPMLSSEKELTASWDEMQKDFINSVGE